MAVLSMFYGIIVSMYYFDNQRHHLPHIHASYQGDEVVIRISDGSIIEGGFQSNKMKLLFAWVEIHKDDLIANWELASKGEKIFKIEPLK